MRFLPLTASKLPCLRASERVRPVPLAVPLVLLLITWPFVATAQEAQEPTRFEQDYLRYRSVFDYGGFQPDLSTILPTGTAGRWTVHGGVDGVYSDNYEQDTVRRDAFSLDGFAGAGWLKNTPRFQGSVDYQYRQDVYLSDLLEDEDHSAHRVSGAFGWQARQHWNLSGGAHFAQRVETGVLGTPEGIRNTYNNRYDEYSGNIASDARLSRDWSNASSYEYRERDYDSAAAEGEDVTNHAAATRFDWRVRPRDTLSPGYEFRLEDNQTARTQRTNHLSSAAWAHNIPGGLGARSATVDLSYLGDRAEGQGMIDYWNHALDLGYRSALSPRTSGRLWGGYQWIRPDEGSGDKSWRYGVDGEHQFSERTILGLSAAHLWDYTATSSLSDTTTLTRVTRLSATLSSQVTRQVRWGLEAHQEQGDVDVVVSGDGDYWQTRGLARVSFDAAGTGFLGTDYQCTRRSQDLSEEDYYHHRASVFGQWLAVEWLSLGLSYAFEYRDYDSESRLDSYRENRITGNLTVRL